MNPIQAIAVITVFSSIYFGMHFYTLQRIFSFLGIQKAVWIIALVLSLTYPLSAFVDRLFHSLPTRVLYYVTSAWLGFVFILFSIVVILELIKFITPITPTIAWVALGITISIAVFALINATQLHIKEVSIDSFGKKMDVVQLSDIHIGTIKNTKFLEKVVAKTNELNPDIVVITGDLVDGSGKLNKDSFKALTQLNAPTYFIMGNHEMYEGEIFVESLIPPNVKVLRDAVDVHEGINIIGIDYTEDKNHVEQVIDKLPFDVTKPSILLNHAPVGYDKVKDQGINLQLSGHTHNGQIFPFTLLVKLSFPKQHGLYQWDNFSLYVSPGTGTWGPPMRLGSNNEITLIHLT